MLVPEDEPDDDLPGEDEVEGDGVEGGLVDVELSPLDSFFAADPSDDASDDEPARLSVR